jgi:DNA-binding response OmpR family regulator
VGFRLLHSGAFHVLESGPSGLTSIALPDEFMAKILVVEDDALVRDVISDCLALQMHTVELAEDGEAGEHRLRSFEYDLIILDWQLPRVSGVQLCRDFRHRGCGTPILMLTGRKEIADKEFGLDAGADDYLTKPFDARELNARVRALLRRACGSKANILSIGDLSFDTALVKVFRNDVEIRLLPKEYAVLEFLLRNKNKFYPAEELLNAVWSSEAESTNTAVRQCISRLREKIDIPGQPSIITTRPGLGYGVTE